MLSHDPTLYKRSDWISDQHQFPFTFAFTVLSWVSPLSDIATRMSCPWSVLSTPLNLAAHANQKRRHFLHHSMFFHDFIFYVQTDWILIPHLFPFIFSHCLKLCLMSLAWVGLDIAFVAPCASHKADGKLSFYIFEWCWLAHFIQSWVAKSHACHLVSSLVKTHAINQSWMSPLFSVPRPEYWASLIPRFPINRSMCNPDLCQWQHRKMMQLQQLRGLPRLAARFALFYAKKAIANVGVRAHRSWWKYFRSILMPCKQPFCPRC